MSVAFRREGDDEHLEPKFELPIPPGPNLVTARGLEAIKAKVVELEAMLAGLSEETAVAKVRRDLRYWSTRQSTAQLVPPPDGSCVAFGTRVTFRQNGKVRIVSLVGDDEADPAAGLVSFSAPLSRAMMDAEVGEFVDFAGKEEALEILEIAAIDA